MVLRAVTPTLILKHPGLFLHLLERNPEDSGLLLSNPDRSNFFVLHVHHEESRDTKGMLLLAVSSEHVDIPVFNNPLVSLGVVALFKVES